MNLTICSTFNNVVKEIIRVRCLLKSFVSHQSIHDPQLSSVFTCLRVVAERWGLKGLFNELEMDCRFISIL